MYWPEGKRAAVSLTYDDGLASQREHAVEQLTRFQLPATFFLTGTSEDIAQHKDTWKALVARGFELGSHTMHHPCDKHFDWVKPGFAIQDYNLQRMGAELDESTTLLRDLGAAPPFSFAYPCGETGVGASRESYVALVKGRFVAARSVQSNLLEPALLDLSAVPAFDGAKSKEQLIALVDQAEAKGAWLVFYFHGVGGDYLQVSLDAHEALLQALRERANRIWTERFGTVADYMLHHRS